MATTLEIAVLVTPTLEGGPVCWMKTILDLHELDSFLAKLLRRRVRAYRAFLNFKTASAVRPRLNDGLLRRIAFMIAHFLRIVKLSLTTLLTVVPQANNAIF